MDSVQSSLTELGPHRKLCAVRPEHGLRWNSKDCDINSLSCTDASSCGFMNYLYLAAPVLIETLRHSPLVFKDTGLRKLKATEDCYLQLKTGTSFISNQSFTDFFFLQTSLCRFKENLTLAPSNGSTKNYIVTDLSHIPLSSIDLITHFCQHCPIIIIITTYCSLKEVSYFISVFCQFGVFASAVTAHSQKKGPKGK